MQNDPSPLNGKRIIITGGTTGIGRSAAFLLAQAGANVFICGRHQQALQEALEEGENKGIILSGTTADISKNEDVQKLFDQANERLGGLDILIANAAVSGGSVTDEEEWRYVIDTNLSGTIDCVVHAVRVWEGNTKGRHIVLIGSMSADVREKGSSIYVATKSALQGFSESLRKELNPKGIHVHLVEPGRTRSDLSDGSDEEERQKIAEGTLLAAEDIAHALLYLLSQPERCSVVDLKIRPLHQPI